MKAFTLTARELAERGLDSLPEEFISGKHLIYSSPATLAFNSPGAEGFGVKRAGLAVPGSVMLIVSPGCCGRNTSLISAIPEYRNRFFYLTMDDNDIVTGKHLKRIPEAVKEVVDSLKVNPSVVMICITCVDALLGTDMERVCRKAEALCGTQVRPCYMYALTREGRRPPMVHVRQSLYSLLKPLKKKSTSINLLGFFAPLQEKSELFAYMKKVGVKKIRQISACESYEEFMKMGEANFNLVLNPEARHAAADFEKNLGIGSIELTRFYDVKRIHKQYKALGKVLGVDGAEFALDSEEDYKEALAAIEAFREKFENVTFSVGECVNADSFELAAALVGYGFSVSEIFGTITDENKFFVKQLAESSPDTKIYSNMEPTMLYYDCAEGHADITIGKDAGYYHQNLPNLPWNEDRQPFGYQAVTGLFGALMAAMEKPVYGIKDTITETLKDKQEGGKR